MRVQRSAAIRLQLFSGVTLWAALLSVAVADESTSVVLGTDELQKVADRIRTFKPKDEFDARPVISNLTGQAFSVTVKPRKRGPSNSICDGFPSWGYFAEQNNLEVAFNNGNLLTSGLSADSFTAAFSKGSTFSGTFLRFASFTCNKLKQGQYTATNAFGATTRVAKETDIVLAFSDQGSPNENAMSAVTYWSHSISGDAARKLSENIAVRITGTLGVWANGQNVICGTKASSPRMNFPYDQTLNACIFKATSLQFEVLDQRTGEVLHRTASTHEKK